MQLVLYGWAGAEWNSYLDDTWVLLRDCKVKRGEIRTVYLDEEFRSAYRIFKDYKRHGLPNGKGSNDEPADVIELINLMQDEVDAYEFDEHQKRMRKNGHSN